MKDHEHHNHSSHQGHGSDVHHAPKRDSIKSGHHAHAGHDKHAGHSVADFKKRFFICVLVTIPIMLLSEMIQHWAGFALTFYGDKYVLAVLSSFVFFYGGWPFLKGTFDEVRSNAIGMMTLIGVAITTAWAYSLAVTFGLKGMDFYWEMATLIDIMLIGHYYEMKSVTGASQALQLLVKMLPATAHRLVNSNIEDVPVSEILKDDIVLVKPGEKIPVDGIVIKGESYLDESMLTGESKPVKKSNDQQVIAGAINGNGSLEIKVLKTGADSYLNKVIRLMEEAQSSKSRSQNFADQAAKILTFVALGGGIVTLVVWLSLGYPFAFALERMVTVMVISCPHALGLAVPLVVSISTSVSAQRGLLIRNRTAFENARKITTILFDKTGTLTVGSHELNIINVLDKQYSESDLLTMAAAVEKHSDHFISAGILRKAKADKIAIPASSEFNYMPGEGLEGIVNGNKIKVVGPNYLRTHKLAVPSAHDENVATIVYILVGDKLAGSFSFSDTVRKESFEAIRLLREKGIKSILITGDNENVAKKVSEELQMDGYMANVLPHEKLQKAKELQQKGEFVAMTGDGINDAPALAQADVGIAVGSGTDVAAETADIILVNSNPADIAKLILFGRATYRKMVENLVWATGYNVIAIPLAAGVLYQAGILLSPAVGAVLMSVSTIVVAFNAQLLKRKMN
jgi:P-type Cu2+ transporter